MEAWQEADPTMRGRFDFPIHAETGAASSAVICFKVDPEHHAGKHRHSAEKILLILEGEAEAVVADERGRLSAGGMVLVPSTVVHDLYNVGSEPLRVVGFFSSAAVVTILDEPLAPIGLRVLVVGAPPPEGVDQPAAASQATA